jgi:ATP-dependent DNA helicase RecQ
MTATASNETATSLSGAFRRDLDVVRISGFRPNLFYTAERLGTKEEKARRVVALCRELRGQGIVYVSSRRDGENLAGVLGDNGVRAVPYHAGLEPRLRATNQDRFMRGDARVVVATVAFGMGVDKPDIRFIIHFSPSTSLEAYAQESGRAGRDGKEARCVLLYTTSDRANQTRLAQRDAIDLATLRKVYAGIKRHAVGSWAIFDPSRIVLGSEPGDDSDEAPDPRVGIGLLVEGGLLARHPNTPVSWTLTLDPDGDASASELVEEDVVIWNRFAGWARLDEVKGRPFTFQTTEACNALGVPPETLARVLATQQEWSAEEGTRLPCLELFPVEATAAARLQQVLDAAANRARDRVNRTMIYAEGRRCRHAELAAHLGERLSPCGDACDVCTGEAASSSVPRASRDRQPRKRSTTTAADALVALKALASAPFSVGKTGLTRLLEGSIQSRIQGDRSPYFGALGDLQKSKIEAVIDSLVADEALVYDRTRDFPVLRITEEGALRLRSSTRED